MAAAFGIWHAETPLPRDVNKVSVTACGEARLLPVYSIDAENFENIISKLLKDGKSKFMLRVKPGVAEVTPISH